MFGARFDDVAAGSSFILTGAITSLTAWSLDDVRPVLDAASAHARAGRWVAGYVAYDAGPAFDAALVATKDHTIPYAWFGVFTDRESPGPKDDLESPGPYSVSRWTPLVERDTYDVAFGVVRDHIAVGDVYQVNLTLPMRAAFAGEPASLYDDLVEAQEAGYASHLWQDDIHIVSVSPERFFGISDDVVVTRPMKGTQPRGRWTTEDEDRRRLLETSDKDRAENLMIVDLVRNDLGRVATFGSVAVDELFAIEKYRTVWQMTSQISARLRADATLSDVFDALFPCGSVTGAPKTAAMEIIAKVEPHPRGVYCGAIGFIPPGDGRNGASFSVAIRTAVVNRAEGVVQYGTGGGVTWGSEVDTEYAEAMAKVSVLTAKVTVPGLIETLRWDGDWYWRDEHLDRMTASADFLGVSMDVDAVADALDDLEPSLEGPSRVRIEVSPGGDIVVDAADVAPRFLIGPGPDAEVITVEVDFDPVDESEMWLFHKISDRSTYDVRMHRHPHADDVILTNRSGFATETAIANLVCRFGDRWVTPPLGDGLLPGILRGHLLAEGRIHEGSIPVARLFEAEAVAVISSVRGWRSAVVDKPR